eukprot:2839964-Amphidinium_carterae.1
MGFASANKLSLNLLLDVNESGAKISGLILLGTGIREYLKTEEGLTLTRTSISQFECSPHTDTVSEYNMLNMERVRCLFLPQTPGASNVRCTLESQTPEVSDLWKGLVKEVRDSLKQE